MQSKVHGGTFVAWRGTAGEKIVCRRLPAPLSNYDAEPWGGLLIVASQANSDAPEILETENLREDIGNLCAKIGSREVFWVSERNAKERAIIKTKLGAYPTYIG